MTCKLVSGEGLALSSKFINMGKSERASFVYMTFVLLLLSIFLHSALLADALYSDSDSDSKDNNVEPNSQEEADSFLSLIEQLNGINQIELDDFSDASDGGAPDDDELIAAGFVADSQEFHSQGEESSREEEKENENGYNPGGVGGADHVANGDYLDDDDAAVGGADEEGDEANYLAGHDEGQDYGDDSGEPGGLIEGEEAGQDSDAYDSDDPEDDASLKQAFQLKFYLDKDDAPAEQYNRLRVLLGVTRSRASTILKHVKEMYNTYRGNLAAAIQYLYEEEDLEDTDVDIIDAFSGLFQYYGTLVASSVAPPIDGPVFVRQP
jgi:hypothetical protein